MQRLVVPVCCVGLPHLVAPVCCVWSLVSLVNTVLPFQRSAEVEYHSNKGREGGKRRRRSRRIHIIKRLSLACRFFTAALF